MTRKIERCEECNKEYTKKMKKQIPLCQWCKNKRNKEHVRIKSLKKRELAKQIYR